MMGDYLMDMLEKPILHVEKLEDCEITEATQDALDTAECSTRRDSDSSRRSTGTQQFTPHASPLFEDNLDSDCDFEVPSTTSDNLFAPVPLFNSPETEWSDSEKYLDVFPSSVPSPPSSLSDVDISFTQADAISHEYPSDIPLDLTDLQHGFDFSILPEGLGITNIEDFKHERSTLEPTMQRDFPYPSASPIPEGDPTQVKGNSPNRRGKKAGRVSCEICGKEFVNDWGVRRHTATAHPDQNTQFFRCDKKMPGGAMCGYKTYRRDHLLIHYKKHRSKQ